MTRRAMNILPIEVRRSGDSWVASHETFEIELPPDESLTQGMFSVGIRPEDAYIVDSSRKADLVGTVEMREPQGDALLVYVSASDQTLRILTDSRSTIEIGDSVHIRFDTNRVHLFDRDGQAVYHAEVTQSHDRSRVRK